MSLFSLDADPGVIIIPGAGPVVVDMEEQDLSIHYGHHITPRLTAGLGLSPYSKIKLNLTSQGGPALMAANAEADAGARLGVTWQWGGALDNPGQGDFIGLVYDYYRRPWT